MLKTELSRANAICKKLSSGLNRLTVIDVSGNSSYGYSFAVVRESGTTIDFPDGSGSFVSWKQNLVVETSSGKTWPDDLEQKCELAMSSDHASA